MNKQTISQDQEAPPQPYLVSSVFSSTIYKTLGTRMAIPITPRESSRVLQIQQKWYFSAKKSYSVLNLRSSEQKIQEHRKGALLFSSFFFFIFFIFWFLHLSFFGLSFKQEPWQKGVRVLEGSHYCWPGILWFCFLFRKGTSSVFNYGQSCQKCTTKKHLDISNADEASTGWVGIKAEL